MVEKKNIAVDSTENAKDLNREHHYVSQWYQRGFTENSAIFITWTYHPAKRSFRAAGYFNSTLDIL